jgi:hypothetical protein
MTWRFGQRRKLVRFLTFLDCDPWAVAVGNVVWRVKNPRLYFRVRRELAALRVGRAFLEA